jgi:DNA-binding MltR family transcriptional regulator
MAGKVQRETVKGELKRRGIDLQELVQGTHPGIALVLSSLLDDVFGRALRAAMLHLSSSVLNELLTGYGPLRTFSAKIHIAHGMKLVTAQHCRDAHLVRKVRNEFAHKAKRLDFTSAEIVNIGARFSTYDNQKRDALDAYTKAIDAILNQLYAEIQRHMTAAALAKPRSDRASRGKTS